jgi:hypothetical protein
LGENEYVPVIAPPGPEELPPHAVAVAIAVNEAQEATM